MDSIAQRIGALLGTEPHPDETPLAARRTPISHAAAPDIFLGLHVDTFQGSARRFATGLIYLNEGIVGGETAFPLAISTEEAEQVDGVASGVMEKVLRETRLPQIAEQSEALLAAGCFHTTAASTPTLGADGGYEEPPEELGTAALELLDWAGKGSGLRIQPREGRLILFFTRTEEGKIDPYSWHGGCAVRHGGASKLTLQAFKQIPGRGGTGDRKSVV